MLEDELLVRNKNNDSLIDFSVNNFDDDYRSKVTNFFRPNDKIGSPNNKNLNLNNQGSKLIKNNSFGFRPRFFKNNVSSNNTNTNNNSIINNSKIIKTNNQAFKTNEIGNSNSNVINSGFLDFTHKKPLINSTNANSLNSSLLSTKDLELTVGGNNQSITLATKPKRQPKEVTATRQITKPVEKILDLSFGSEDLHEINSVKRWSNQLGHGANGGAMPPPVSLKNSIFDEKSSSVDSNEIVLTNRKVKFDHIAAVKTLPPTISKIVDIIEREGTTFSIKMSYDHPFANNRDNALSPHTYLDLDIDPNLELARQNTFMNKMIDFDIFENKNTKKSEKEKIIKTQNQNNNASSVDLYQKLNNPCPASMYAELNTSIELESYRSRNKKSTGRNRNYIKVKSKKPLNTKSDKSGKKKEIVAVDDNLIVESMIEYKMIEKKDIDLVDEGVLSLADFQSSSTYQSKKDVGKNDLKILESLIATVKSRDILKESTVKEVAPTKAAHNTKSSSKQQKSTKGGNTNKKTIKEFKYCILTDLKIGEGEFSETFQGYRYDLGPPLKVAAKRLKNANKEKDDQNMINLLSEISVLTQLGKHDNVIEYLGVHNLNNEMYMVFEYAEKGKNTFTVNSPPQPHGVLRSPQWDSIDKVSNGYLQ